MGAVRVPAECFNTKFFKPFIQGKWANMVDDIDSARDRFIWYTNMISYVNN